MTKVSNEELRIEIAKSKELGETTDRLGELLIFMARRHFNNPRFRDFTKYTIKEELIVHAINDMLKAYPKIDLELTNNPFAFLVCAVRRSTEKYFREVLKK